ncbi:MAG: poly-gamma-glutamate synthesis protein (capsule biosynthesis protein) [Parcubacteria group bacterium Gr01-1014_72]|nr:MAG: poly-gamma-glutamate synthesis protein (capsule biosynthesis protein) [Parcubacteria group bacterium Gr01-1014_72]
MPPHPSFDSYGFRYVLKVSALLGLLLFVADFGVGELSENILLKPYTSTASLDASIAEIREGRLERELTALAKSQEEERGIVLGFGGDIMLDRGVEASIAQNGGSFTFPFEKVAERLREYDILFGNLEGPVSDKGSDRQNLYSFRMSPRAIGGLTFAGFDVVSVANNHTGDWGVEALRDTLARLREADIAPVGAGEDDMEAYAPVLFTVKGVRIAFLAASQFGKGHFVAGEDTTGIALIDEARLHESILSAREEGADIVIISFHYGDEYTAEPNAFERRIARKAIDLGADLVIGHHPHVLQPIEVYKGGYIAYSLGNFIFDQGFSPETMTSGILTARVVNKKIKDVAIERLIINKDFQLEFP